MGIEAADKIVIREKAPTQSKVHLGTVRQSHRDDYMIGAVGEKWGEKFCAALRKRALKHLTANARNWHCRWPTHCSELGWGR